MRKAIFAAAMATALALGSGPLMAQSSSAQHLVEEIIEEVTHHTLEALHEVLLRNTGIDPLVRGYIWGRSYHPVPSGASDEVRRELWQLNEEHDRTIGKLEEELQRKLEQAVDEFRREAAREDKVEKVREKRGRFHETVDHAFDVFEEKVAEENARYDEKRDQILRKL